MIPDPDCAHCGGSGIDPDYPGDDHGMPYGIDPGSLQPCACMFEQKGNDDG